MRAVQFFFGGALLGLVVLTVALWMTVSINERTSRIEHERTVEHQP